MIDLRKAIRTGIIFALCSALVFNLQHFELVLAKKNNNDTNQGLWYKKPSPKPNKIFFFWSTGGFDLQPEPEYSFKVGTSISINTHSINPKFGVDNAPQHTWFTSTDGKTWSILRDAEGEHKYDQGDLVLNLKTAGTTYYQLEDKYPGEAAYYSNVATVHTLPDEIKAEKIEDIELSTNYLYNPHYNSGNDFNKSTAFATAKLFPHNSTAKVTWSVDKPFAKVDPSGKITITDENAEGSFFVNATIKNEDNSTLSKAVLMNVGGGLYDRSVRAGKQATFQIQGFNNNLSKDNRIDFKVSWYKRKPGQSKATLLNTDKENPFSYTTGVVTEEDNNTAFYATITHNGSSLTTSEGRLTVYPREDPNVTLTNSIVNDSTKDPEDNNLLAKNVIIGDRINYQLSLKNDGQKDLHDTVVFLYLYLGASIKKIEVDGNEISENDFSVIKKDSNNAQLLNIKIGSLPIGKEHNVVIKTQTEKLTNQHNFSTQPYFLGTDSDNNHYQTIGKKFTIAYISNTLTAHFNDIQFETIVSFQKDPLKFRLNSNNAPNFIAIVDDQRKKKNHIKLSLKQNSPMINHEGTALNAKLMFHKSAIDSNPESITNKVAIADVAENKPFTSIAWEHNEGLLLHIQNSVAPAGDYHTTLSWIFEDVPS